MRQMQEVEEQVRARAERGRPVQVLRIDGGR